MSRIMLFGLGGAVVVIALYHFFARWERHGREHWVLYFLLGLIITESILYANSSTITRGLFHPGSGSLQFRLPEVIIAVALVARLTVKGSPRTAGKPALLWAAVAMWFALEMVEGHFRHNDFTTLVFEAKLIVYVMGAYALASGVSARTFFGAPFVRMMRICALAAVLLTLMTLDHRSYDAGLPLVPLVNFGQMGTDAATIFVSIGIVGLLLELAKERRNTLNLLCVLPLLGSAFFAFQRAVLIMLGTTVVIVVIVAMGSVARRRLRVHVGEVVMTALAVVGVSLAVSLVPAATSQSAVNAPFASTISHTIGSTLGSRGKIESAQDRINKWSVAWDTTRQHVILGWGLGKEYTYFATGPNVFVTTGIAENLELDLLLTTGVIGLVLFFLAMGASVADGFSAWRLHPDRTMAVLALALVAVVVGFMAKGQVESIFENYRLATEWGLFLGLLRSVVTSGGGSLRALRTFDPDRQYEVV